MEQRTNPPHGRVRFARRPRAESRRSVVIGLHAIDGFCFQRYMLHSPPAKNCINFLFLLIVNQTQAGIKPR
jgi:hypothetical protein